MSEGGKWRFQRSDGTWVRWDPGTQSWVGEDVDADVPETTFPDAAETAFPDDIEAAGGIDAADEIEPLDEPGDSLASWDDDEEAADPPQSARDRMFESAPRPSIAPAVLFGAIVGIVAGIVLLMVLR
ncbi:MAG TPA: hypothetical protein VFK89_08460 [Actinomycetota bacterium]|nr:hypothetical protein [Actinomycetota bacterium]